MTATVVMCLVASFVTSIPVGYDVKLPPTKLVQSTVVPPGPVTPVRVSHYWPQLGRPNCSNFVNGQCISRMASGERWQDWMNHAAACVPEWPFGTTVTLDGKRWTCMDRGGGVEYVSGVPWVDLLQERADYAYGAVITATIEFAER